MQEKNLIVLSLLLMAYRRCKLTIRLFTVQANKDDGDPKTLDFNSDQKRPRAGIDRSIDVVDELKDEEERRKKDKYKGRTAWWIKSKFSR